MPATNPDLLTLEHLSVGFISAGGPPLTVLREVSFSLKRGECFGIVGESGCGKSLTALAILGLLPDGARVLGGRIHFDEVGDLLQLGARQRRLTRGSRVGMIFQDPMNAMNPLLTIGFQIRESLRLHRRLRGRQARRVALELLERVAMPDPESRLGSYAHELSGGQRQRAMIALALASEPELLLADEPTTALDVTVQAQILELLAELRRDLGLTVLLITHDLGVVAQDCDRVAVMYAGQVVEQALTSDLFQRPAHPYSRALISMIPRLSGETASGRFTSISGVVPEFSALPAGCSFAPRCSEALDDCSARRPSLVALSGRHRVRCWLHPGQTSP